MKTTFLLAVGLTFTSTLLAQFYAPDTEFHDLSQRTFPVEAARVLAWQRNLAGAKIAEVTYQVATTPERETVWTLQWLDAAKKPVREKTVRYPESLLVEGPKYFREVFKQLTGDDWKIDSAPPDNAASAFWQGADQAGVSRLEALAAAGKLIAEKPKMERAADDARLVGILVHGALPSISTSFTLDSVLLSRAAAWLALAEATSREPFNAAWCPILFLAGREHAASALWAAQPAKAPDKRKPAERLWDFLLRPQQAKDAFLFAANPENKTAAMPVMAFASGMDTGWAETTVEIAGDVLGDALLARLHEYMVGFAVRGGVGGGHFAAEAPEQFLEAWEKAMSGFTAPPADHGAGEAFAKAQAARPAGGEEQPTAALQRLAPVLNIGLDQRGAPLLPTAFATQRDLVGYGWEMAGRQFGAHHDFLRNKLGDPVAARAVAAAALGSLKGCDVFFSRAEAKPVEPLKDLTRLQFTSSTALHTALSRNLPPEWRQPADLYLRRLWLLHGAARETVDAVFRAKAPDEVTKPLLERLVTEGGAENLAQLVLREKGFLFPAAIDKFGLRARFVQAVPWALLPQSDLAWSELGAKGDKLGYARRLEQLSWDNSTPLNEALIFFAYVEANALPAAKRFYSEIVPFVTETVGFSNTTGPARFVLAWRENDDAGMQRALRDGATYSWRDLNTQATYAVHRGDLAAAEKILEAMSERYGDKNKELAALKDYLALVPALNDPKHADHARAVDSFPQSVSWQVAQWILLRQAKLLPDEALRFLGGDKAPAYHQTLVAYLKGDKAGFEKPYEAVAWKSYGANATLAALLRNDLRGTPLKDDLPDLKPAGAKPLAAMIADARQATSGSETAALLDFSKFKTADEFWTGLEKFRAESGQRDQSPKEIVKSMNAWLLAARAFIRAYPQDARRWDVMATALTIQLQVAQFGPRSATPPTPDEKEIAAILAAPDASATAKGEAAYLQLMQKTREVNPNIPHTFPPFHRAIDEYLANYGSQPHAEEVAAMQIELVQMPNQPGADNILKKLAAHPNPKIAAMAKEATASRERMAALRSKPLELKVPTTDGKEIDFAKLRGKVVLLDFWASWCGPCMAELPSVVKTFEKLHEKGFEIVGISLDQDREAMDRALKKYKVTWPQNFDGAGWQTKIAQQFGIRSIPAAWLFDRKGALRETDLRGEELAAAVEKLLRE